MITPFQCHLPTLPNERHYYAIVAVCCAHYLPPLNYLTWSCQINTYNASYGFTLLSVQLLNPFIILNIMKATLSDGLLNRILHIHNTGSLQPARWSA